MKKFVEMYKIAGEIMSLMAMLIMTMVLTAICLFVTAATGCGAWFIIGIAIEMFGLSLGDMMLTKRELISRVDMISQIKRGA